MSLVSAGAIKKELDSLSMDELPSIDFEMAASKLLYDSDDVNIIELIRTGCTSETPTMWCYVTSWYSDLISGRKPSPKCDIEIFKRVYIDEQHCIAWDIDPAVDSDTVWSNKIDLCPDACYIDSVPLENAADA